MGNKLCITATLGALLLGGCKDGAIPLIGIDRQGHTIEASIPVETYERNLDVMITSVQESAQPALERADAKEGWRLRTAVVGAGVNAEGGIGLLSVGVFPRFRLIFSNSTDPTVP